MKTLTSVCFSMLFMSMSAATTRVVNLMGRSFISKTTTGFNTGTGVLIHTESKSAGKPAIDTDRYLQNRQTGKN